MNMRVQSKAFVRMHARARKGKGNLCGKRVRNRSFSVEVPIVNPKRSSCRSGFFFQRDSACMCNGGRMLRARNDLKQTRVSRSKVLISADDLTKSQHVKECQKVCHASENGAEETTTARCHGSNASRSFVGI